MQPMEMAVWTFLPLPLSAWHSRHFAASVFLSRGTGWMSARRGSTRRSKKASTPNVNPAKFRERRWSLDIAMPPQANGPQCGYGVWLYGARLRSLGVALGCKHQGGGKRHGKGEQHDHENNSVGAIRSFNRHTRISLLASRTEKLRNPKNRVSGGRGRPCDPSIYQNPRDRNAMWQVAPAVPK